MGNVAVSLLYGLVLLVVSGVVVFAALRVPVFRAVVDYSSLIMVAAPIVVLIWYFVVEAVPKAAETGAERATDGLVTHGRSYLTKGG